MSLDRAFASVPILAACALLAASCSGSPQAPSSTPAKDAPQPTTQASLAPQAAPAAVAPTPAQSTEPAPPPKAEPPAAPASKPAPAKAAARIEVAATKPGLTRIGADKCKMCHKIEHTSWEASAHARQNPPLDCESCHGPGSEYKTTAVMKDEAKAKAAGLVMPDASFCTKSCHGKGWSDSLIEKVHAHKAKTS